MLLSFKVALWLRESSRSKMFPVDPLWTWTRSIACDGLMYDTYPQEFRTQPPFGSASASDCVHIKSWDLRKCVRGSAKRSEQSNSGNGSGGNMSIQKSKTEIGLQGSSKSLCIKSLRLHSENIKSFGEEACHFNVQLEYHIHTTKTWQSQPHCIEIVLKQ